MNTALWQHWLERLYNLRRDKRGLRERPHKPALLLSVIDLLDRDAITRNEIELSEDLVGTFKRYFEVVRQADDQPSIQNPFYFLCGDHFWELVPQPGQAQVYIRGSVSRAPSVAELRRRVAYGRVDEALWALLREPHSRHQLREAIIARYFPEQRDRLAALAATSRQVPAEEVLREETPPQRDPAFRRVILTIYDYRCAACGVRVLLNTREALVEAAHLIPFEVSRNDKPTNGIALCPNHHWAMDRFLIAPCPDAHRAAGVWQVAAERLDDRIDGQRDLVALAGRPVIPPTEEKFLPAVESLRWREQHLARIG